jgi:gliding motility-associated lipoprotein GldH
MFVGIICALILMSCGPKHIYQNKQEIAQPWSYNQQVIFDFEIIDTASAYDLTLDVIHASDFSYENMYVKVITTFPDGKQVNHPLSLQLAGKDGNWIGNCSGEKCSTPIALSSSAYYRSSGKYRMSFEQYSRKDTIRGIEALQLSVSQSLN